MATSITSKTVLFELGEYIIGYISSIRIGCMKIGPDVNGSSVLSFNTEYSFYLCGTAFKRRLFTTMLSFSVIIFSFEFENIFLNMFSIEYDICCLLCLYVCNHV